MPLVLKVFTIRFLMELVPVCRPPQVSAEMIKELGLSDEELGVISLTITNLAEKAQRRRARRTSSTNSSGFTNQVSDCRSSMPPIPVLGAVHVRSEWMLISATV